MASLLAPPGSPAQAVALITANFGSMKISIEPIQGDVKEAILKSDTGENITNSADIGRYIAKEVAPEKLYPDDASIKASIDKWLDTAMVIERNSIYWLAPKHNEAIIDEEQKNAKTAIEDALQALNAHISSPSNGLVLEQITLADIAIACALVGIYQNVLGEDVQSKYGTLTKWLSFIYSSHHFAPVLGPIVFCKHSIGWYAHDQKKKEVASTKANPTGQFSTEPSSACPSASDNGEIDPEKLAKKLAKQAEKEAKKAKALAKKAAAASAANSQNDSKKAKAKAEAETKRAMEAAEVQAWIDAARATPSGSKKDVAGPMPKGYAPVAVESAWYDWWEKSGYFKADPKSDKPPFVIVIPPPNVTGSLHIGHALTDAIEDTMVRWRRMSGYNALWVPGVDHAGIATQTVVEKKIARELGKSRHELGREGFMEEVWKWVSDYGHRIDNQIRRMGASVDWDRKAFTMDENRSVAVKEAFLQLHSSGLIYRDNRLVNWCCRLKTAVSDIEVDYIDIPCRTSMSVPGYDELVEFGVLTSFAYPLEDGGEIVVATTRPETMLGDTAVAVHPEDTRYAHLHGKFAVHPVNGRRIPIITDAELVDPSFGTGAVKITPAHDPNDFATGKRHNLEFINILDDNGCLNSNGTGNFAGEPRFKVRATVVEYLKEKGLFRGTDDNPMRLGICSRSKDVIEPVLKPQWWVDCQDMAAKACQVVRDGRLEIIPPDFEATWFRWMENIRDWCISRQLWWGHRIPAYYVQLEGDDEAGMPGAPSERMDRWVVAESEDEARNVATELYPGEAFQLLQDEDVLDTWFSSGLFPFSVFNWPVKSPDLDTFYPGAVLETGHDILFFWVARMVMMGMQLTGEVPFKQVYLHAMVRDAHGRKMSKSLGNVIDPIDVVEGITLDGLYQKLLTGNLDDKEVERAKKGQQEDFPDGIEECGTDALRFALVSYTSQGRDINLDIKRVVAYRYWCNKLWNAIRFAMINLGHDYHPPDKIDVNQLNFSSRWILSRLSNATKIMVASLDKYEFSTAAQACYHFWQYELCDVFIELIKPIMAGSDENAKRTTRDALWSCLESGLRLLHPFMPFVTEELWQRLPKLDNSPPSIMISQYPVPVPEWQSSKLEANMAYIQTIVSKVRSLRSDYNLVKQKPPMFIACKKDDLALMLAESYLELTTLTLSESSEILVEGSVPPKGCGIAVVDESTTVYLSLSGILDAAKELEKLTKREQEISDKVGAMQKTISLSSYQDGTPATVKIGDQERLSKLEAELNTVRHHIGEMRELLD